MLSEARKKAKPQKCILCGKEQSSFCNSHSVPQMCLRPIADQGKVLHASLAMGFDVGVVDLEGGVNNSGTFNNICRECDKKFFQDYENPNNIIQPPTDKMLAEIAVKNMLLQLNKRVIEIELVGISQKQLGMYENPDDVSELKALDQQEYEKEVIFHQDIANNNKTGGYQVLFSKVLPYKVPIAAQSAIVLPCDMEGNMLNDVENLDKSIRMQYIHIAVLPLEKASVVLVFYHKRDNLYRRLRHQINTSSQEKVFCYGLRNQVGILVDGTVVPCCLDSEGTIELGNIFNTSFTNIIEGKRASDIYNGFSKRMAVEELCKKCGYATRFKK